MSTTASAEPPLCPGPDRAPRKPRHTIPADRCVWGSNWPHPESDVAIPNDGDLLDLFCEWVPDEAVRRQILVTNPEKLYGFT